MKKKNVKNSKINPTKPSEKTLQGKKYDFLPYLVFVVLSFIIYGQTLNFEYVYDDGIVITNNEFTKKGISGIPGILKYDSFYGEPNLRNDTLVSGGRYRPLSMITFAVEKDLFGLKPSVSHLINLLLYILTAMLIYKLVSKFIFRNDTKKAWYLQPGFITAILFIVHPVHTEIVANVKGRDEILCFLFAFYALYLSFKYIENERYPLLIVVFLMFFLSLLSKESSAPFVVLAPLTLYFFNSNTTFKKIFLISIPYFIALVVYVVIRYTVIGGFSNKIIPDLMNDPFLYATTSEKLATIVYCMGYYLKLLFFPHPLTYDYYPYHIQLQQWLSPGVIVSLVLWIALIVIAIVEFRKKSVVSYAILFVSISLSLVSNILFPIGVFISERFLYIPSFAFSLFMGWLFIMFLPETFKKATKVIYAILGIIIVMFGYKAFSRTSVWKTDETLLSTDVVTSSNSAKSNLGYATLLKNRAEKTTDENKRNDLYDKALLHIKKALSIYPKSVSGLRLYADVYFKRYRNPDTAIYYYLKSDSILPARKNIYNTIGTLFGQYKANYDTAIYYFNKQIEITGPDADTYKKMAICYLYKRDTLKAFDYASKALEIEPNNFDCQSILSLKEKRK